MGTWSEASIVLLPACLASRRLNWAADTVPSIASQCYVDGRPEPDSVPAHDGLGMPTRAPKGRATRFGLHLFEANPDTGSGRLGEVT